MKQTAHTRVERIVWIDILRGLGIALVVIGHAIDGFATAYGASQSIAFTHDLIYTFHMPLFFLLAGMFAGGTIKQRVGEFAKRMGSRIIHPFILWSVIHIIVTAFLSKYTNHPTSYSELWTFWLEPVSVYWFLQSLLLAYCIAYLMRDVSDAHARLAAAGLIVLGVWLSWHFEDAAAYRLIFMPGFFLLGQRLDLRGVDRAVESSAPLAPAILGAIFVAALIHAGVHYKHPLAAITGAAAFSVLAAFAAKALERGRLADMLSAWGRASIAIFTAHLFFVAGMRIALERVVHVEALAVVLPCTIIAGIVGPWLVYEAATRLRVSAYLGWR